MGNWQLRKTLLVITVLLLAALPIQAQNTIQAKKVEKGDTLVVAYGESAPLMEEPEFLATEIEELNGGTEVVFVREKGEHAFVSWAGRKGWMYEKYLSSRKKYIQDSIRANPDIERIKENRSKGYTVELAYMDVRKNSADGITLDLTVRNISGRKTIKYIDLQLQLFNSVGDTTPGRIRTSSIRNQGLVGPIEPGTDSYYDLENLWYSASGNCVEVQKMKVEHVDGTTFTYVNDLKDVADREDGVRISGGCSYENQN